MASELKPCPFCAGSNLETYYADIEGWIAHIKCIDCDDMIGPMSEFKYETQEEAYEDASKRWNTRPPPLLPYRRMLPALMIAIRVAPVIVTALVSIPKPSRMLPALRRRLTRS